MLTIPLLHGDLNEEIYMKIPQCLEVQSSKIVCKHKNSLYGLKQASRQWHSKLSDALKSKGFKNSKNNCSLFSKKEGESIVFIAIYVDDILLTGTNINEIQSMKELLDDQFKIKDLGDLVNFFLGIEVVKKNSRVILTQWKFAKDLIEEYDCKSYGSLSGPLPTWIKLDMNDGFPLENPLVYRCLIGKHNYLTHFNYLTNVYELCYLLKLDPGRYKNSFK